jgi:F-type H+-transporting ATPase subunit alpha
VEDIRRFEHDLYDFLDNSKPEILETIRTKKQIDDELKKNLTDAIKQFKGQFQGSDKKKAQPAKAENNGNRPAAPEPKANQPAEAAQAK